MDSELTSLVDTVIPPERRISLGEGQSQFLRDESDPESITDVYWLGSIVGAVYRQQPVSLVFSTEGVLILHGDTPEGGKVLRNKSFKRVTDEERSEKMRLRLNQLRAGDREVLLMANTHNRWLPQEDIREARLAKRAFAAPMDQSRVLSLQMVNGEKVKIHLKNERQVSIAKELAKVIGQRFQG